jgi:hypothetical protein
MKWFSLVSFIAGLVVCILLVSGIALTLAIHRASLKTVVGSLLSLLFIAWTTREMFRSYRVENSN